MIKAMLIVKILLIFILQLNSYGYCGNNPFIEYKDVLIIYHSGTPLKGYRDKSLFKTVKKMKNIDYDIVTSATPMVINCHKIAKGIEEYLAGNGVATKILRSNEIADYRILKNCRLLVIGTPSRFWNVSWEIKKFIDENFSKIGAFEKKAMDKHLVAAFAMSEIVGGSEAALRSIRRAVNDINGKFGPTATFLTDFNKRQLYREINRFGNDIIKLLK
jgi:hypothetical protein